jgi:uncharacterized protein
MEIRLVELADKVIVYRPLAGLAFVGNRAMAKLAARFAVAGPPVDPAQEGEAGLFLQQIGFFEPDPAPPQLRLPDPSGADFQPTLAVLLLTNRCQLRCVYCYAAAGELPRKDLDFELGGAAIDFVCQTAIQAGQPRFDVTFHGGGEPTTAWKVMQACTEYARQKALPAWISLTSNGIWSRSQMDWIMASLNDVSISMDGGRETQDRQRPFASGRGSSGWIMQTLAELDRRSFSYGIRVTATAPWEHLPEDVRFLCEETGCRSIQVEPAFNTGRGGHGQAARDESRQFIEAFLESDEIASRLGRSLYCSSARQGVVSPNFCTAPYRALIVNPEGDLVTCYEITGPDHPLSGISRIGRIENGQVYLDFAARARLHGLLAERRQACRDCLCYWSCAGDCYTRAFDCGPEGHLIHKTRCDMTRSLTSRLLLRSLAQSGGIWRSPWRPAPASAVYAGEEGVG